MYSLGIFHSVHHTIETVWDQWVPLEFFGHCAFFSIFFLFHKSLSSYVKAFSERERLPLDIFRTLIFSLKIP